MSYIPIFIIVHNQFEILKKSVASYEKLIKTPIKIIFHDVASTYKPTLDYLEEKKQEGYTVYRSNVNHHHTVINSIVDYRKKNSDYDYYVLTDPDIELDNSPGNILDIYTFMLEKFNCNAVGPMLRIDDIPDYYPGKKLAIARHRKQFWSKPKQTIKHNDISIEFIKCSIDTTFQLCRRNNVSKKFPKGNCIRLFSPYAARHLDWYINPNNLTPCQKYYQSTTTGISHWNNPNYVKNLKILN